MERKEKVFAYISSEAYIPLKLDELAAVLDVPSEDRAELSAVLKSLELDGRIEKTKKGRYVKSESFVSGILRCAKRGNFGFVETEDGEAVYVKDLNGAFHSDRVLVRRLPEADGKSASGRVVRVLERNLKNVIGVLKKGLHACFYCMPDDSRIYSKVRINPENMNGAKAGERVLTEITAYDASGHLSGRVLRSLGSEEDLKGLLEAVIISNGIKTEFNDGTLKEAEKLPESVQNTDGRLDLRNEEIFTIDGETARDFDDAVSIKALPNGSFELGVHIADVSAYVKKGSELDREAYERGTSVYLPDRVIPMLPEKLSCGICSLNPNEDRLALSVFMEIDRTGKTVSYSMHKSVIRSKCRMTYEHINDVLENGAEPGYAEPFMKSLRLMAELAEILKNKRIARGAVELDLPETKILTDENGYPSAVFYEERGISNQMIEEFMLAANEAAAELAFWAELPFIYRVHEAPSAEKITALKLFLKPLGLSLRETQNKPVQPRELERIMTEVKNSPEEKAVAGKILRSLMKAEYSEENEGHFGLAAKYYCHFTSPIRRYPDLEVHRSLKLYLDGKQSEDWDFVKAAAKQSSKCEQNAENTERDADDLMKTVYMSRFVGEEFSAAVSGVASFGLFAELENGVEGIIRAEDMKSDFYEYDEANFRLTGKRTGESYTLGDKISVVLVSCNVPERRIRFVRSEDWEKSRKPKERHETKSRKKTHKAHKSSKANKSNKANKSKGRKKR